ncbi:hypothetical protein D9758_013909 [Tetrapyrgos nigripes]|uniref:Uncharacterized protein n=1 Tax=Tetrapyrgos nigripes TaxID=182062 RepID=A0A8H5CML5_9AGAR|nr:hypothetical protein D9758_013909 [Tetrapyrgos nigripes]
MLTCPSLQIFHMIGDGIRWYDTHPRYHAQKHPSWPGQALNDFFTRSNILPTLHTFSLKELPIYGCGLLSILEKTPSLRDLTVHELMDSEAPRAPYSSYRDPMDYSKVSNHTVTEGFLKRLSVVQSGGPESEHQPIVPQFRSIEMKVYSSGLGSIEEMVRARWEIGPSAQVERLKSVVIKVIAKEWDEWFDNSDLYEFKDPGLVLKTEWQDDDNPKRGEVIIPVVWDSEDEE